MLRVRWPWAWVAGALFGEAARAQPALPAASRDAAAADAAPTADAVPAANAVPPATAPVAEAGAVTVRAAPRPGSAGESVRDRPLLRAAPHRTASDLLLTVPGAFVTQHSGEGKAHQIFFRGFDAVHGQDLELLVAGLPVNQPGHLHGQGYADLHFVPPEAVRRVRALSGPFAASQGDFAVAGSVLFELGWEEPGAQVAVSAGRFGTRRLLLGYRPEGEPEPTFAVFEAMETAGFGPGRRASRAGGLAQFERALLPGLGVRVLGGGHAGSFGSAGVLRAEDVESGRMSRFGSYDTGQGGRTALAFLLADLHGDRGPTRWSLSPWLAFSTLDLRQNYTGFLVDPQRGDRQQQLDDRVATGLDAAHRRPVHVLSRRDRVAMGVSTRHDAIRQSQARRSVVDDSITAREVDAEVRLTQVSGWAELGVSPVERLLLRAGLRATGVSVGVVERTPQGLTASRAAQGTHLGEKAGFDLVLLPGVRFLASYGAGYRSPQPRSLGDGERSPFTRVRAAEAGLRWQDGERWFLSLAGFHTQLSDDLVFDETTARNERAPASQRLGAALDLVAAPTGSFTSSLGATWVRATFTGSDLRHDAGARVPFVPGAVLRSDTAYRPGLGRLLARDLRGELGLGLSALHDRPLPFGERGSDVLLVDARASVRLAELELGLDVTNLLDAAWWDGEFVFASQPERGGTPSLVPVRHVTAGRPRTWLATLTLHL